MISLETRFSPAKLRFSHIVVGWKKIIVAESLRRFSSDSSSDGILYIFFRRRYATILVPLWIKSWNNWNAILEYLLGLVLKWLCKFYFHLEMCFIDKKKVQLTILYDRKFYGLLLLAMLLLISLFFRKLKKMKPFA